MMEEHDQLLFMFTYFAISRIFVKFSRGFIFANGIFDGGLLSRKMQKKSQNSLKLISRIINLVKVKLSLVRERVFLVNVNATMQLLCAIY